MTEKEVREELNSILYQPIIELNDREVYVYVSKLEANEINLLSKFYNNRLIRMEILPSEEGEILISMTVY